MPKKLTQAGYVNCLVMTGVQEVEHRLVMTAMLGRPLAESESVHHRNGDRSDNRPENLELWNGRHAAGQRHAETLRCPACGTTLRLTL